MYGGMGRSDPGVFSSLVRMGADPFSTDRSGRNYLHAVANLERSPFAKDREGQIAEIAAVPGDPSGWMGADAYGGTPLHYAVLNGHTQLVSVLADAGADVTGTTVRDGFGHVLDFDGVTPLMLACLVANTEAVGILLDKGADPDARDMHGRNAMHYAVTTPTRHFCREIESIPGKERVNARKTEIMSRLSDPDCADEKGRTPLVRLLTENRYDDGGLTAALLEAGADPDRAANDGTTPLMAAASNGHSAAVKALVLKGADMDRKGPGGKTALHMAIGWRDEKSARYLVKKGARSDIPDDSGKTASEMAAAAGMEAVLEVMLRGVRWDS